VLTGPPVNWPVQERRDRFDLQLRVELFSVIKCRDHSGDHTFRQIVVGICPDLRAKQSRGTCHTVPMLRDSHSEAPVSSKALCSLIRVLDTLERMNRTGRFENSASGNCLWES
jgi:hypothetical protein